MICYRVEDIDEHMAMSTPYCFCKDCRRFIINSDFEFCPWCGHRLNKRLPVKCISREEFNRMIHKDENL